MKVKELIYNFEDLITCIGKMQRHYHSLALQTG